MEIQNSFLIAGYFLPLEQQVRRLDIPYAGLPFTLKRPFVKKKLKPVMFVGTCSDAGKSVINAAFCRIFRQDGYNPAPFKAQNMSLNSYPTPEGGEIGRAQVVQAEACGIIPHTDMNPVLLKPTNDKNSQVILNGHPIGNMSAQEYFGAHNSKEALFKEALNAFKRLDAHYNPIVLEGAGSISEINLRDRDITNMRMAIATGASSFLIADIDRGGVFGSVYGTIQLLTGEERALIKGIIINKFRGDIRLFEDGKRMLEQLTGIPVVSVIPYFHDICIEDEDSVSLNMKRRTSAEGKINVAIVLLRHMSNFTDFNILETDDRFHAYYTHSTEEIGKADIIILPGSKNTIDDLHYLRAGGMAQAVIRAYKAGKKVIGICGGYQMMGTRVEDPDGIEGDTRMMPGLGLLPQTTVIEKEKVMRQSRFRFRDNEELCTGYEIHMGHTTTNADAPLQPAAILANGQPDGYYLDASCWGSYLHGIFDNRVVLDHLAEGITRNTSSVFSYADFKEEQYDKLAGHVRQHSDMEYIYKTLY